MRTPLNRLKATVLPVAIALVAMGCFPAPTAPAPCPAGQHVGYVQVDSIPVVRATAPHDTVSWSPVLQQRCIR